MPFVSAPELKQNFEEPYGSFFGGYWTSFFQAKVGSPSWMWLARIQFFLGFGVIYA